MWETWLMRRVYDKSSLRFLENYCLYSRQKDSSCTSCMKVCPDSAIQVKEGKVHIDMNKCSECKLCIHECPTDAFYLESERCYQLEQKIKDKKSVCYTCENQQYLSRDIVFPCISSIKPEHLIIGMLHHVSVQIYFDPNICKDCQPSWNMEERLAWVNELSGLFDQSIEIIQDKNEKNIVMDQFSRRKLFSITKSTASKTVGTFLFDAFNKELTIKDPIPLPEKRQYFIEFMKRRNIDSIISKRLAKKLNIFKASISENCNLCERCVKQCPTNALLLIVDGQFKKVEFNPSQCIGCNVCNELCKEVNISLDGILNNYFLQPTTLIQEEYGACPQCGDLKNTKNNLCFDCQLQKEKQDKMLDCW